MRNSLCGCSSFCCKMLHLCHHRKSIFSDVQSLFRSFLASVCILWRNVSLDLLTPSWLGCLFCWIESCMRWSHILEMNPLSTPSFAKIFPYSVGCLFIFFFKCFLGCAKAFTFKCVPFAYFCFYFHYSRRRIKKDFAVICVKEGAAHVFL